MRTPYRDARLRLLRAEHARRAPKAADTSYDPRAHARPGHQASFARDPSRFREACTSRRAGKSTTVVDDALGESWEHPNSAVLYLNTTRDRAKRTVWEEAKEAVRRNGMPYVASESALSLRGPGNRWVFISGGESKKYIDRWKGTLPPIVAAYIDEGQDWDEEVLAHAIDRVILPALADRGGRLTITGTPGPAPDGFYYDLTQNPEWSHHSWNMFDIYDPAAGVMVGAHELLADALRIRGVDVSDPTIQREFFGRWVRDTAILVFGALDDSLNAYDVLPDGDYLFGVGIDGGYVDEASIATLGWKPIDLDRHVYVKSSEVFGHRGAIEMIERVVGAIEPLGSRMVVAAADPAAGMKNIAHDVWTKFGIQLEVADKADKVGGCKLLASSIATRELLLPRSHRLFRSLRRVQWDPDHRGEKLKGHTPDDVDALLYGYRKAWPWISQRPPAPAPTHDEEVEARILERQREAEDGDGWS
jgi:hypothetical protein